MQSVISALPVTLIEPSLAKCWAENGRALTIALSKLSTSGRADYDEAFPKDAEPFIVQMSRTDYTRFVEAIVRNLPRDLGQPLESYWSAKTHAELPLALRALASRKYFIGCLPVDLSPRPGTFKSPLQIRTEIISRGARFPTDNLGRSWAWDVLKGDSFSPSPGVQQVQVVSTTPTELGLTAKDADGNVDWDAVCGTATKAGLEMLPFEAAAMALRFADGKTYVFATELLTDSNNRKDVLKLFGDSWTVRGAGLFSRTEVPRCNITDRIAFGRLVRAS
jgi:hypothetical protein